jgi:hypothetical protein
VYRLYRAEVILVVDLRGSDPDRVHRRLMEVVEVEEVGVV